MLYLFDLDGTLISSYMEAADKNYNIWEVLPGRREFIKGIFPNSVAVVTNQGGVAFGKITEGDVRYKFHQVAQALGFSGADIFDGSVPCCTSVMETLSFFVSYEHPKGNGLYRGSNRRKPSGVMIHEARQAFPKHKLVTFIGDREEDLQAAQSAQIPFRWADEFFLPAQ